MKINFGHSLKILPCKKAKSSRERVQNYKRRKLSKKTISTNLLPQLNIINLSSPKTARPSNQPKNPNINKNLKKNINSLTKLEKIKISDLVKNNQLYMGSIKLDNKTPLTQCLFDLEARTPESKNLKNPIHILEKVASDLQKRFQNEKILFKKSESMRLHNSQRNRTKQFNLVYKNEFPKTDDKKAFNYAHKKKEFFSIHSIARSKSKNIENPKKNKKKSNSKMFDIRSDLVKRAVMKASMKQNMLKKYKNQCLFQDQETHKKIFEDEKMKEEKTIWSEKIKTRFKLQNLDKIESDFFVKKMRFFKSGIKRSFLDRKKQSEKTVYREKYQGKKLRKSLGNHISMFSVKMKKVKKKSFLRKRKFRRSSSLAIFKKNHQITTVVQEKEKSENFISARKGKSSRLMKEKEKYFDESINPWCMEQSENPEFCDSGEVGGYGVEDYLKER